MKLLWIAGWYPNYTEPHSGDFVKRHAEAASLFSGIQVIFVARDPQLLPGAVRFKENIQGRLCEWLITYNTPRWTGKVGSQLTYARIFKKYIRQYIHEHGVPDLVHFYIGMRTSTIAAWVKKKLKIPVVFSEQWTGFLPEPADNFNQLPAYLQRTWRQMARYAAGAHCVSVYLQQKLELVAQQPLPAAIIPNATDTSFFHYRDKTLKKNHFVHVAGSAAGHKNTEDVLKAFALLLRENDACRLDIAGPYDQQLKNLAHDLGLVQNITWHGIVLPAQLSLLFQQAKALIMYSRYETFGCVVTEAQACGTMVVAADIPVLHETVMEGVNGFFAPPENPVALKELLKKIANGDISINNEQVAKSAAAKYNYEAVGRQFAEWYELIRSERG
ncbi:MAG TPA: glycosyltransferase [Chitinophagaceae bacterium]|nr:glycosyltransferase [Chitinophagaceae bacterium]